MFVLIFRELLVIGFSLLVLYFIVREIVKTVFKEKIDSRVEMARFQSKVLEKEAKSLDNINVDKSIKNRKKINETIKNFD